ncbi:MAG: hypothetical protein ACR2QE_19725 [Acidimicrobiales bacterium]
MFTVTTQHGDDGSNDVAQIRSPASVVESVLPIGGVHPMDGSVHVDAHCSQKGRADASGIAAEVT